MQTEAKPIGTLGTQKLARRRIQIMKVLVAIWRASCGIQSGSRPAQTESWDRQSSAKLVTASQKGGRATESN